MLDPAFKSLVGYIPTPMVHGLTLGKRFYGCAEGWVEVPESWQPRVDLWVEPRHQLSIGHSPQPQSPLGDLDRLVPVAVPFEPTVSAGRGTEHP